MTYQPDLGSIAEVTSGAVFQVGEKIYLAASDARRNHNNSGQVIVDVYACIEGVPDGCVTQYIAAQELEVEFLAR